MTNINSKELINNLNFCIIDLETTGGNHQSDKIIEIGLVKIHQLEITEEKSYLINPEKDIPEFIQRLTKISPKDVADKPKISEVIEDIIAFIGDDILVAHNTSFDIPFLNGVLKNLGKPTLKNKVICTNVMTKHLIPEMLSSNLSHMCKLFDIGHKKAHRALDDAKATAKLLLIYLNIFIDKNINKVNQLYYPRNKFELDRAHFYKNESSNTNIIEQVKNFGHTPLLITIKGERGLILANFPLSEPSNEVEFLSEILEITDWEIVTLKILRPVLEGLFEFSNHYNKYPEAIRTKLLTYLVNRYKSDQPIDIKQVDFVFTPHLITGQISAYSFLNLNTNTKHVFKIPAQKKKLLQFLTGQNNRFEKHNKGRRTLLLSKEVTPLVENFLATQQSQGKYLFLSRKELKNSSNSFLEKIESFNTEFNYTDFPKHHL